MQVSKRRAGYILLIIWSLCSLFLAESIAEGGHDIISRDLAQPLDEVVTAILASYPQFKDKKNSLNGLIRERLSKFNNDSSDNNARKLSEALNFDPDNLKLIKTCERQCTPPNTDADLFTFNHECWSCVLGDVLKVEESKRETLKKAILDFAKTQCIEQSQVDKSIADMQVPFVPNPDQTAEHTKDKKPGDLVCSEETLNKLLEGREENGSNNPRHGGREDHHIIEPDKEPTCTLMASPNKVKKNESVMLILTSENAQEAYIETSKVSVPVGRIEVKAQKEGNITVTGRVKNGKKEAQCFTSYTVEEDKKEDKKEEPKGEKKGSGSGGGSHGGGGSPPQIPPVEIPPIEPPEEPEEFEEPEDEEELLIPPMPQEPLFSPELLIELFKKKDDSKDWERRQAMINEMMKAQAKMNEAHIKMLMQFASQLQNAINNMVMRQRANNSVASRFGGSTRRGKVRTPLQRTPTMYPLPSTTYRGDLFRARTLKENNNIKLPLSKK